MNRRDESMSDLSRPAPDAMREACDRTEIIINRALNCNWITVNDREQLKATLRIALNTEVAAGGPYLDNGWNRSAPVPSPDGAAVRWQRVNDEPFEYAIQQGQFGDEFVKLLNGSCLRRDCAPSDDVRSALADEYKNMAAIVNLRGEFKNEKKFLIVESALRSAPVSAPADKRVRLSLIVEALESAANDLKGNTIISAEKAFTDFAKLLKDKAALRAPAVGVTREAIEFLISTRAVAYSQQSGKLFSGFTVADDFHSLAVDILAFSLTSGSTP